MPNYSSFMKQIKRQVKTFHFIGRKAEQGYFFHRFNAVSAMQKCTPSEPQNIQKYGKFGPFIGFHNIWVKIASRLASGKFVNFSLKPGNLHGISYAKKMLVGCMGTVIGDGGYVSAPLKDSFAQRAYGSLPNTAKIWLQTPRKKKDSLKDGQS
jgi:hypothetical protein